jgi:hypothetical protein
MISDQSLGLAIKNVAAFGDTDVFPAPIEKHWFGDEPVAVLGQLRKIRDNYTAAFNSSFAVMQRVRSGIVGAR